MLDPQDAPVLPQFLIFLAVMAVLLYGAKYFASANPAKLAKVGKTAGGVAALGGALFLMARGRIEMAIGLGGFGLYLLGFLGNHKWADMFRSVGGTPKTSTVRSPMIEMELDHETGSMQGRVLAGEFEGRGLADLTRPQCEALFTQCARDDPEGARLLDAYLDRRFPGRRAAGEADGDTGGGRARQSGAMTEDEAYQVLGLAKGATREDIAGAHRALMKKLHPDHGGTSNLAARVNEAREVLLRRHT